MGLYSENDPRYGCSDIRWNLRDFELGEPLGRGKYGVVYKARIKTSRQVVALKVLNMAQLVEDDMYEQLQHEVEIHSRLKHPNIVQLLGYFYDPKRVYLVLEYCEGGELYKEMKRQPNGRFHEEFAAKLIAQLVSALSHCHSYNIIHRDVKPENIFLAKDKVLKLGDFGWAAHDRRGYNGYLCTAKENLAVFGSRRTTMCGTLDYLAPEMVNGKAYDESVDNWTVGVLAYELLVGVPPFETCGIDEAKSCDNDYMTPSSISIQTPMSLNAPTATPSSSISENAATFRRISTLDYSFPEYVSEEAQDLIRRLLHREPDRRLSLEEVMRHPWLQASKACCN